MRVAAPDGYFGLEDHLYPVEIHDGARSEQHPPSGHVTMGPLSSTWMPSSGQKPSEGLLIRSPTGAALPRLLVTFVSQRLFSAIQRIH